MQALASKGDIADYLPQISRQRSGVFEDFLKSDPGFGFFDRHV